jgi:hypothetical protein
MQTLKEKLKEDLKTALRTGDSIRKSLIQVILGEVALEEGRGASSFRLNDDGVLSVIKKIKKNQDLTKCGYVNSGRDVPEFLNREIEMLEKYLPQQLSHDQIKDLIHDIIEEIKPSSIKDMGIIVEKFNSEFRGRADGKIVADIIKERLSKL